MRVVRVKPAAESIKARRCSLRLYANDRDNAKFSYLIPLFVSWGRRSVPGDRCFPTLVVRTVAGEAAMNSEALRKPDDVKLEVGVQIKSMCV